ncbi:MAG: hypothetical protein ABIJ97_00065, partial [Bacteroidota bacterium]
MKNIIIISLIIVALTNTSFIKKKWIITKQDNIILYTRPAGFTETKSPDNERIKNLLNEARLCIDEINKTLKTDFNDKIKIFIYNKDEAKEKIGTDAGGGAIIEKKKIVFVNSEHPNYDSGRHRNAYIGVHEYVHIVSYHGIGFSYIKLLFEGYANAIDGHYGCKMVDDKKVATPIEDYITLEKIKKPSELLDGDDMFEGDFYPQSGFFIKWLFNEYSVDVVNKLFILKREGFENEFEKITG